VDRASGIRCRGEGETRREVVFHGIGGRTPAHEHTVEVDRQPGGGGLPHSRPDDLRLGWQHHLERVLRLSGGIIEQDVLRPRADVDGEDRTV
jgi:hypothetical protein